MSYASAEKPKPQLHVYRISYDSGEIAELDISLEYLETITGFNIAELSIDFHPVQAKLGVTCWHDGVPSEEVQFKFIVLDLPMMGLKSIQPSPHEQVSWMGKSNDNRSSRIQRNDNNL